MNKTDFYTEIRNNNFKTYLLLFFFFIFVILIAIALKHIFAFSGFGILFFAVVIAIIYALVGYYKGDKIVLSTSKAKPADEQKFMHLHNVVEGLAIAAGIPKPKVYIIQDDSPNAFATGRDPEHASVVVTTGLLKIMNREELEGVIGHELSHVRNRDIRVMTIVTVLFGLIAMASDIALRSLFWGGGNREGNNQLMLIIAVVFVVLAPIVAMMIQMAISRKREFLADASSAQLTRYPQGLANALKKISQTTKPVAVATKGTAHMYIANPLRGRQFSKLFDTHPPIQKRIAKLESM